MRRMLNQLSTPPVPTGAEEPWGSRGRSRARIRLGREFHDDLLVGTPVSVPTMNSFAGVTMRF